ncbi:MAG: AAA family ATPase [Actinomycetota bacterium]
MTTPTTKRTTPTTKRTTSRPARRVGNRNTPGAIKQPEPNPLPRCWQDVHDVLDAGIDRIILFGPPGTGKTYAGLNLGEVQRGAHRLICTEDMTAADVTGCWMPSANSTWSWLDGQAVKAWRGNGLSGARLVIDEIDKASGDVFALLLAVTDSTASACWEHPETGRIERPLDGFSVVMTTNVENLDELPEALTDRFPVAIRINEPHPDALRTLSYELRDYARRAADLGDRRISLRAFHAFDRLRAGIGDERAAAIVFRDEAPSILDAIKIDRVAR